MPKIRLAPGEETGLLVEKVTLSEDGVLEALQSFAKDGGRGWVCTTNEVHLIEAEADLERLGEFKVLHAELARPEVSLALQHLSLDTWQAVTLREVEEEAEYWALDRTYVAIDPRLGRVAGPRYTEVQYRVYWPMKAEIDDACIQPGAWAVRFVGFVEREAS